MAESPWEDNILERKLESDLKDLLKTLVAFANSVQPGHKATLFIGENDKGDIQGVTNPDNIQKQVRKEGEKIFPPIPSFPIHLILPSTAVFSLPKEFSPQPLSRKNISVNF